MDDNIFIDEILKVGVEVLFLWSNILEISKYSYIVIDDFFYEWVKDVQVVYLGYIVVVGENYVQGFSWEYVVFVFKYLGQLVVIVKSYVWIGWQNLVNFGIFLLEFINFEDYEKIGWGDMFVVIFVCELIQLGDDIYICNFMKNMDIVCWYSLSGCQVEVLLKGGIINYFKE